MRRYPIASNLQHTTLRILQRLGMKAARRLRTRRRNLARLATLVTVVMSVVTLSLGLTLPAPVPVAPVDVGFTYSQRQAAYLDLPWDKTFEAVLDLSPALVRLGAYWDEIERKPGEYDFTTLDWLLDRAAARERSIVLVVGMKSPRWPEYYLPGWLEQRLALPAWSRVSDHPELRARTLNFVSRVVRRYRDRDEIAYWQVENEPLDPAGPRSWRIGADFLAEEVELVRQLDDRPVIVTMFVDVNPFMRLPAWRRDAHARASSIVKVADVLGLDLYPSRGHRVLGQDVYLRWSAWMWKGPVAGLQRLAERAGRLAWVMEAQAEPWEAGRIVYTDPPRSRSVYPATAAETFEQLRVVGFDTIFLWGVEHWYMRLARHDDHGWWDPMSAIFPDPPLTALQPQPGGQGHREVMSATPSRSAGDTPRSA